MIINFPTALYISTLPSSADDTRNVTFTISSENPPRSTTTALELFRGEELRRLPEPVLTESERRKGLGERMNTVTQGTQTIAGSGIKAFEVGEFIEFGDTEDLDSISVLEVPEVVDLQHNTNRLDLVSAGLTKEESNNLIAMAEKRFSELLNELNCTKSDIKDAETQIDANQRSINEVRKALEAAEVVFSVTGATDNNILDKLNTREEELIAQRTALIASVNELNGVAKVQYNQLVDLKEVVR